MKVCQFPDRLLDDGRTILFLKIHYNLIYYLKSYKYETRKAKSIKIVKFKKNSIISCSGLKSGNVLARFYMFDC